MGQYVDGYYVFSKVTPTDHQGILYVAVILSFILALISVITRVAIRWKEMGIDDFVCLQAMLLAIGQYIAVLVGMSKYGIGRTAHSYTADDIDNGGRAVQVSQCIFIVAISFTKVVIIFFMRRIFTPEHRAMWRLLNVMRVVILTWSISSILGLTVKCSNSSFLSGHRCTGLMLRWSLIIVLDNLLETVFVLVSISLVWNLQMPLPAKLAIVSAFSGRALVILLSGLHARSIRHYIVAPDPGTGVVIPLVLQQVQLGWALIAATIPTLASQIRGYDKAPTWHSAPCQDNTPIDVTSFTGKSKTSFVPRVEPAPFVPRPNHGMLEIEPAYVPPRRTERLLSPDQDFGLLRLDKINYEADISSLGGGRHDSSESSTTIKCHMTWSVSSAGAADV